MKKVTFKTKLQLAVLFSSLVMGAGISTVRADEQSVLPIVPELDGLDSMIQQEMAKEKVPGLAMAVVRDGRIVYARGFGYRDVAKNLPVTTDTLFPIADATKSFTATAIQILVDEKRMNWQKPVKTYLPDFKLKDEWVTQHVTLLDCAAHRVGYRYLTDNASLLAKQSRYDVMAHLAVESPGIEFRTEYAYSNRLYTVLANALETITGTTWEQNIEQRILQPLKMTRTKLSNDDYEADSNHAIGYGKAGLEKHQDCPTGLVPSTGMSSSVTDMAKWLIFNLRKGKVGDNQLVKIQGINTLHTPYVVVPDDDNIEPAPGLWTTGLGWFIDVSNGSKKVSHPGYGNVLVSMVTFWPKQNVGWVFFVTGENAVSLRDILEAELTARLVTNK